jgi:hypothetical protein
VLDDSVLTEFWLRDRVGRFSLTKFWLKDRVGRFSLTKFELKDRVGRCSLTKFELKDRVGRCSLTRFKLKDRVGRCSLTVGLLCRICRYELGHVILPWFGNSAYVYPYSFIRSIIFLQSWSFFRDSIS